MLASLLLPLFSLLLAITLYLLVISEARLAASHFVMPHPQTALISRLTAEFRAAAADEPAANSAVVPPLHERELGRAEGTAIGAVIGLPLLSEIHTEFLLFAPSGCWS